MKTAEELRDAAQILAGCYWDRALSGTLSGIQGFDRRAFVAERWTYFVSDARQVLGDLSLFEQAG